MRAKVNVEDVFGDLQSLETERLLLRKLSLEDAGDLFAYASDPEVARYTTWEAHKTIDDSRTVLSQWVDLYATGQVAPWGVVHKGDAKLIGTCGFVSWAPRHARAEVAYALSRPYWGKGYTTEAVRAVIAFGFNTKGLNRIEARCDIPNIASARVMEKVGMKFEGVLRQQLFVKGVYVDLKMYSILRTEWAAEPPGRT
jgi:ribosomal-protein-alanine N-acetyltransferase